MTLILLAALGAGVSEKTLVNWLDKTMQLESGGNHAAIGDGGASRGAYQIQKRTWAAYSTKSWKTYAHHPAESRRVARLILIDCERACRRAKRPVTFANVRWFYRHGGF